MIGVVGGGVDGEEGNGFEIWWTEVGVTIFGFVFWSEGGEEEG